MPSRRSAPTPATPAPTTITEWINQHSSDAEIETLRAALIKLGHPVAIELSQDLRPTATPAS